MKVNIEQRTEEWKKFRESRIGASEIGTIMGLNPYETPLQWWERRKGLRSPKEITEAMQIGIDLEQEARDWTNVELGYKFEPAVYQSDEVPYLIASLDGIDKESNVILEIKCSKKAYENAERGKIDEMYRAQIHQQLYCSGASYAIFVAYHNGQGASIRIDRNDDYLSRVLVAAVNAKEEWLDKNIPPDGGYVDIDIDNHQASIVKEWIEAAAAKKSAEEKERQLKKMLESMGDDGSCVLQYDGTPLVKMCRVQPDGRIDYDALLKDHGITEETIELYRKPVGIGYYKITSVKNAC